MSETKPDLRERTIERLIDYLEHWKDCTVHQTDVCSCGMREVADQVVALAAAALAAPREPKIKENE